MDNKTKFIEYCQRGQLNKVISMMQDNNIYEEMTELYIPHHIGGSKKINRLFLGIRQCIIYGHYDMALFLIINYNVDIKMSDNNYLEMFLNCSYEDNFHKNMSKAECDKYINFILDLYDKNMPNYNRQFRMLCDNHNYHNVKLLLKKYNYKIDIYTETENSFKVACVDCDMNIVKLLINTSKKKPYNKMFNIYYLETTPVFNMVGYGFEKLFIYMASCGTYKHYENNYKFII